MQSIGGPECHDNAGRYAPIITNDEVVPERTELSQPHDHELNTNSAVGCVNPRLRRNAATNATANTATAPTTTGSAASEPGQCAPAPSAPQNVPNAVSMTPTTNFIEFSGTLARGARTAIPASATTMTAAPAASEANGRLWSLAPNVSAMNTTSRPSRTTPLNANVKAYQSV